MDARRLREDRQSQRPTSPRSSPQKESEPRSQDVIGQVLALQRLAGNKATTALIQRKAKKGVVEMEPEVIDVSPERQDVLKLKKGEAETAIGREIDRYVATIQQGHRLGLSYFGDWYRGWERAKEDATFSMVGKIFQFLLKEGLKLVFPEEEEFFKTLKEYAEKAFEKAVDYLGEIPKGDVAAFLAKLQATEEVEITKQLDVHDAFMKEHPDILLGAEMAFVEARSKGWENTEKLPPSVLDILRGVGIGLHGAGAASVFAERWLTAHIEGVYREDTSVMQGTGGGYGVSVMAEIAALRETMKIRGEDNRERIYELERGLNRFWRTIVDINSEGAEYMHTKLGIDRDDAVAILESRSTVGPFTDPRELVSRKILSQEEYNRIWRLVVAH